MYRAAACCIERSGTPQLRAAFRCHQKVNISGTVKEYEARNPHSYLHVNAVDENGRTREYVCESHGVTQLSASALRLRS
jgi:hypothetical protein